MSQKDDLISRQAAVDYINHVLTDWSEYKETAIDCLRNLPSAEPERKKPDNGYMWICPECGLEVHSDFARCVRCGWDRPSAERKRGKWEKYVSPTENDDGQDAWDCLECGAMVEKPTSFCPRCGADMRGGEDA